MASSKKTPPKFNEKMSYSAQRNKINMWEIVTSVDKKKRGVGGGVKKLKKNDNVNM